MGRWGSRFEVLMLSMEVISDVGRLSDETQKLLDEKPSPDPAVGMFAVRLCRQFGPRCPGADPHAAFSLQRNRRRSAFPTHPDGHEFQSIFAGAVERQRLKFSTLPSMALKSGCATA